jgi:hypothetical protein
MRRLVVTCAVLALVAGSVLAKELVNTDEQGLALGGFDPVAFHVQQAAVMGDGGITSTFRGAVYRFASTEHKDLFDASPEKYVPAYGGFCAMGVAMNQLYPVEIDTWQIVEGRLILNKNRDVRAMFDANRDANLARADANWPKLVEAKGR